MSRFNINVNMNNFNIIKKRAKYSASWYRFLYNILLESYKLEGATDTTPEDDIKYMLFKNGYITFTEVNGELYGFDDIIDYTPRGDVNSAYKMPNRTVIANEGLNFNKAVYDGVDAVIVKANSMLLSFDDFICAYATLLASLDCSLYIAQNNSRVVKMYESNDEIKKSIDKLFADVENEGELKALAGKPLFNFINEKDFAGSTTGDIIKALIEAKQYVLSKAFQLLSYPSNGNMKRESLNENEIDADIYTLVPTRDNILRVVNEGLEALSKLYNGKYQLKLVANSGAKMLEEEMQLRIEEEEAEVENLEKEAEAEEKQEVEQPASTDKEGDENEETKTDN